MPRSRISLAALIVTALSVLSACDGKDPVRPGNRAPIMISLLTFPGSIGPSDSAIVVCDATDPDGDSLRYDWISDGRLRLRGASPGDAFVLASRSNSQVVTYGTPLSPTDTAWVQCIVRDYRGGGVGALVFLPLHP